MLVEGVVGTAFSQAIEGFDEVANTLELLIDGGKAHIGDFTEVFEGIEDDFSDFAGVNFSFGPLVQPQFNVIDDRL